MEHIYQVLQELGIKRTYEGYHQLATALQLVSEKEERLLYIYKWLYQEVAHIHETTPFCVERNIRTLKFFCRHSGNLDKLTQITDFPLTTMPSNSEFIAILFFYIKNNYESENTFQVSRARLARKSSHI